MRSKLRAYWNAYNDFCNEMVGRLLCRLGFHHWVQVGPMTMFFIYDVKCSRCGKESVGGLLP
jgi:hypothetical protein